MTLTSMASSWVQRHRRVGGQPQPGKNSHLGVYFMRAGPYPPNGDLYNDQT
jgi:hypothetical protein